MSPSLFDVGKCCDGHFQHASVVQAGCFVVFAGPQDGSRDTQDPQLESHRDIPLCFADNIDAPLPGQTKRRVPPVAYPDRRGDGFTARRPYEQESG